MKIPISPPRPTISQKVKKDPPKKDPPKKRPANPKAPVPARRPTKRLT